MTDDARRQGGQTKRARTRAALLGAATDLFEREGWIGTRIEDVARLAGVSSATAYNHFPTKYALMGHVFRPIIARVLENGQRVLESDEPDLVQALETHIRELCQTTRQHRTLTVAFVGAVQEYTVRVEGPPNPSDSNDHVGCSHSGRRYQAGRGAPGVRTSASVPQGT